MPRGTPPGPGPRLLSAAFFLVAALVLGAIGYTLWLVARYWDSIGV